MTTGQDNQRGGQPIVRRGIVAVAISALFAIGYAAGGIALVAAGGSPYFLLAGLTLGTVSVLLWKRRAAAFWLFTAFMLVTLAWSVWESGLDPWALVPRLNIPFLLGLVLIPALLRQRKAAPSAPGHRLLAMATIGSLGLSAAVFLTACLTNSSPSQPWTGTAVAAGDPQQGDWADYGSDKNGSRFSPAGQITTANVSKLERAWTYRFGESDPLGLQVTPIYVGGRLFACTARNLIVALDPVTGRELWRYDAKGSATNVKFPACRGVAFARIEGADGFCSRRIIATTLDARLVALDAATGRKCGSFGEGGEVSLLEGLGPVVKGYYLYSAAPMVARGKIVLGGTVIDNQRVGEPSGVIRAYDLTTGQLSWAYDAGHPDRSGPPPPGEIYTPGTPNSWAQMAFDDKLGLVFVPTGNATPDFFGGQRRPFDDEIASSVMALDIETGQRKWIFQTVHHDIWDYDVGSQPILTTLSIGGRSVEALLQPTKRGDLFALERATGKPIGGIEERLVPRQGAVPGERPAATQPYQALMPSLGDDILTERKMWGITPFDQMLCRIAFRKARYEGRFTPPGLTTTITYPGILGGMDWGSGSLDRSRDILVVATNHLATTIQLLPRSNPEARVNPLGVGKARSAQEFGSISPQAGLPYAARHLGFLSPIAAPCQQPPWSRLTAIDLKRRKVLWSQPLGTGKNVGPLGLVSHMPFTMGVPISGGAVVTAGGLTFIGAATDAKLRAFETTSGKPLWQADLPFAGNATPMSLQARDGRQYIVIAAGGHKFLNVPTGDYLVAYALPKAQ